MKKYNFSVFIKVKKSRIKKRKWWNIFGRDEIQKYHEWIRRSIVLDDYI